MEIYPGQQLRLFVSAFVAGLLLGGLLELLRVLRILHGALPAPARMGRLWERRLPLLGHALPQRETRAGRLRRHAVVAVEDLLFSVTAAIVLELLLYDYNYGEMRPLVPLLMLAGLALWCASVSRLFARAQPYLAFAIAAFFAYLRALCLLPFRALWAGLLLLARPVGALCRGVRWRQLALRSERLFRRQLRAAGEGFGYFEKEGTEYVKLRAEKKREAAACDTPAHHSHFHRGARDQRSPAAGIQPKAAGGGGAGAAKGADGDILRGARAPRVNKSSSPGRK